MQASIPELGVGLVNSQAADIKSFQYPSWVDQETRWAIKGRIDGQDKHGYDQYEIERDDQKMIVPANRLVFMARMLERLS